MSFNQPTAADESADGGHGALDIGGGGAGGKVLGHDYVGPGQASDGEARAVRWLLLLLLLLVLVLLVSRRGPANVVDLLLRGGGRGGGSRPGIGELRCARGPSRGGLGRRGAWGVNARGEGVGLGLLLLRRRWWCALPTIIRLVVQVVRPVIVGVAYRYTRSRRDSL